MAEMDFDGVPVLPFNDPFMDWEDASDQYAPPDSDPRDIDKIDVDFDLIGIIVGPSFGRVVARRMLNLEKAIKRSPTEPTGYKILISFICDVLQKVENKVGPPTTGLLLAKFLSPLKKRVLTLFWGKIMVFTNDLDLVTMMVNFLMRYKYIDSLLYLLHSAILCLGDKSDKVYFYAMVCYMKISDPQKQVRYMYNMGLKSHKTSELLHLSAFKFELKYALKHSQEVTSNCAVVDQNVLNLHYPRIIFESAQKHINYKPGLFYQMYKITKYFKSASSLGKQILRYIYYESIKDPHYWNALAAVELKNDLFPHNTQFQRCINRYEEGLIVNNSPQMWNMYVNFLCKETLNIDMDPEINPLLLKRTILRKCLKKVHKMNQFKPSHYIRLINHFKDFKMAHTMIQYALNSYPNNTKVLESCLIKYMEISCTQAFKLYKLNTMKFKPIMWLRLIDCLSNNESILLFEEVKKMVFTDESCYTKEVKSKLAGKYLEWINEKKSLVDARMAYNELIKNKMCNESLYKAMINIELQAPRVDVTMIRQHFILACMEFGDTDFDLWQMRSNFELRFGTNKTLYSVCYWASKLLKKENRKYFKLFHPVM